MAKHTIIKAALLIALLPYWAYAEEPAASLSRANQALQTGQIDFAFMYYRDLLKDNSNSKYRNAALFASGEYYFMIADYEDARKYFTRHRKQSPLQRFHCGDTTY
jgi:outer membrane protein assembly factor BamD (BamD/ComL family)